MAGSTSSFCQPRCAGKNHRRRVGVLAQGEPAKSVRSLWTGTDPPGKVVPVRHGDERVFAGMPFPCKPPAPEPAPQEPFAAQCAHSAETHTLSPSCSPHHCAQRCSSTSITQSGPFPPCLHPGPGESGNTPCPTLLPTIGMGAMGQAGGAPRMQQFLEDHPLPR